MRLALSANLLALIAQIPEIVIFEPVNGFMHYPVCGRVVAFAVALLAPIVVIWSSRRPAEDSRKAHVTTRLAVLGSFGVIPLMALALHVAGRVLDVRFFWR
jgi:hypothetical protein